MSELLVWLITGLSCLNPRHISVYDNIITEFEGSDEWTLPFKRFLHTFFKRFKTHSSCNINVHPNIVLRVKGAINQTLRRISLEIWTWLNVAERKNDKYHRREISLQINHRFYFLLCNIISNLHFYSRNARARWYVSHWHVPRNDAVKFIRVEFNIKMPPGSYLLYTK